VLRKLVAEDVFETQKVQVADLFTPMQLPLTEDQAV
jgi:hypothetical protein